MFRLNLYLEQRFEQNSFITVNYSINKIVKIVLTIQHMLENLNILKYLICKFNSIG